MNNRKQSEIIKDYCAIDSKMGPITTVDSNFLSADGDYTSAESVGHPLLVPANAHHILIVYEPTMNFITKIHGHKSE